MTDVSVEAVAMLDFGYDVATDLAELHRLAMSLQSKFDAGADSEELLRDVRVLQRIYDDVDVRLPQLGDIGDFGRRFHFMELYLKKGEPENCRSDLNLLLDRDIPALEKAYHSWILSPERYDPELVENVRNLLLNQELDSAVRKAFVILSERLRSTFDTEPDIDGQHLVNAVFGTQGKARGMVPDPEREALRDLLSGLYATFRNRYSHSEVQADWREAEAVVATVNWCLGRIERISDS